MEHVATLAIENLTKHKRGKHEERLLESLNGVKMVWHSTQVNVAYMRREGVMMRHRWTRSHGE